MKKAIYLVLTVFLFSGCEQLGLVKPSANLIGSWQHLSTVGSAKLDGKSFSLDSSPTGEVISFQKDGKCEYGEFDLYKIKGNVITFESTQSGDMLSTNFSIVKDVLALSINTDQARSFLSNSSNLEFFDQKESYERVEETTGGDNKLGYGEFTSPFGTERGICPYYPHSNGCKEYATVEIRNRLTTSEKSNGPVFDQMPLASSGTYPIVDIWVVGGNTCQLTGTFNQFDRNYELNTVYRFISGSLTKTGVTTFSFKALAQKGYNDEIIEISGKGNYKLIYDFK